jgi:hypothetical protein
MNAMYQFICVRKICEMQLLASSCLSLRSSTWKESAPTGRGFLKFGTRKFFENLSRNFEYDEILTRITGTLREGPYMYIYGHISLNSSYNDDFFQTDLYRNQNTSYVQELFPQDVPFMRQHGKNIV